MLRGNRRLSLRHFIDEYDYDEFLEGEGALCATPRALASAFACRLGTVPSEYVEALSVALVAFLAECSGKQISKNDHDAVRALASLPASDEKQFGLWMDAYFRDVS
jgi:hypothetical protein